MNRLADILQPIKCKTFGEPVDAATGRVYHTNADFELPGPIPVVWERTYYSDAAVDGPLGYNWHHSYNLGIRQLEEGAFAFRHADGRESFLPVLKPGDSYFDRKEQLSWTLDGRVTCLRTSGDCNTALTVLKTVSVTAWCQAFPRRTDSGSASNTLRGKAGRNHILTGRIPESGNRRIGTGTLRFRESGWRGGEAGPLPLR